jgi:hypothetical protein
MYLEEIFPMNFPLINVTGQGAPGEPEQEQSIQRLEVDCPINGGQLPVECATSSAFFPANQPAQTGEDSSFSFNETHTAPQNSREDAVSTATSANSRDFPLKRPSGMSIKKRRKGQTAWEQYQKKKGNVERNLAKDLKSRKRIPGEKLSRNSYSVRHKMQMVEMYGHETTENQVTLTDFCQRHKLDPKILKTWVM